MSAFYLAHSLVFIFFFTPFPPYFFYCYYFLTTRSFIGHVYCTWMLQWLEMYDLIRHRCGLISQYDSKILYKIHERLLFRFPSFLKVTPCGRESNSQMSESAKVISWIHVLMTFSQAPWVSCLRTPEHTEESFIIFTQSLIIYTVTHTRLTGNV